MKKEMDLPNETGFELSGTAPVFPPQRSLPFMMNGVAERSVKEAASRIQQDYQKIQRLISAGQKEEAMAGLEEFLRSFPDHSPAHDDLGVLYFQKEDQKQAGDHFLRSLQADPKNWNAAKNLADLLVEQGQLEDAFQFYQRVLAERPDDEEALLGVALVCQGKGLGEDAEFFYRRVQEAESQNSRASTSPREPEDSAVQSGPIASMPPQDSDPLNSDPIRKGKEAYSPASADVLLPKGESLFEERMEESRRLFEEVLARHATAGSF
jgi:tetratricopeptide (TPR) repeat protein